MNPEVQQSDIVDFKPFTSLISNLNGGDVHLQIIDANRMAQVVGLNRSDRTILPVPLEIEIQANRTGDFWLIRLGTTANKQQECNNKNVQPNCEEIFVLFHCAVWVLKIRHLICSEVAF